MQHAYMLRKRFYRLLGYHFFLNFERNKRSKENLELNHEEFRCDTHTKNYFGWGLSR